MEPLPRRFYERDPRAVAPALLGALLSHGPTAGRIVETEAYLASDDPAAHAFKGRTPRTEVLFGPAGRAYVYQTRQHHCLNVAVQEEGVPGCVLIRAVAPLAGLAVMRSRRGGVPDRRLCDGPGKLCQAFAVDKRHYGVDLCAGGELGIFAAPQCDLDIETSPRVGVGAAKTWPLRYTFANSATRKQHRGRTSSSPAAFSTARRLTRTAPAGRTLPLRRR